MPVQSIHGLYDTRELGAAAAGSEEEMLALIEAILGEEPPRTRGMFRMRLEGYSYYEIARKHEVSESSARVICFRAKTKIKQYLEKEGFRYE